VDLLQPPHPRSALPGPQHLPRRRTCRPSHLLPPPPLPSHLLPHQMVKHWSQPLRQPLRHHLRRHLNTLTMKTWESHQTHRRGILLLTKVIATTARKSGSLVRIERWRLAQHNVTTTLIVSGSRTRTPKQAQSHHSTAALGKVPTVLLAVV